MSEPFVGEIRMFAGDFAPRGWSFCDGQLIAVSQNDTLFSLLGTIYGGDGRTSFALPDMKGRFPMHAGTGPGLSNRMLGDKGGEEKVSLTINKIPDHTHNFNTVTTRADQSEVQGNLLSTSSTGDVQFSNATSDSIASTSVIGATGGSESHNNIPPFLCINFIISLSGIYPSRA